MTSTRENLATEGFAQQLKVLQSVATHSIYINPTNLPPRFVNIFCPHSTLLVRNQFFNYDYCLFFDDYVSLICMTNMILRDPLIHTSSFWCKMSK